jgi:hypothetical protein
MGAKFKVVYSCSIDQLGEQVTDRVFEDHTISF